MSRIIVRQTDRQTPPKTIPRCYTWVVKYRQHHGNNLAAYNVDGKSPILHCMKTRNVRLKTKYISLDKLIVITGVIV